MGKHCIFYDFHCILNRQRLVMTGNYPLGRRARHSALMDDSKWAK
ncbi:hypothetical protein SC1_00494 [Sphingopyxis sp. C-1]|nr:hypothetical protein SC1_00494 [Sphingopyxis sp. C-1]